MRRRIEEGKREKKDPKAPNNEKEKKPRTPSEKARNSFLEWRNSDSFKRGKKKVIINPFW